MLQTKSMSGTWKLVSLQFEDADTKQRRDMYGPKPQGYLILTEAGRMMALLTSNERTPAHDEAALFKSMMAYTGNYRLDNDKLVIQVDVAWHPGWIGSEQIRFFQLDGDLLSIASAVQSHPMFPGQTGRGVMVWQRV